MNCEERQLRWIQMKQAEKELNKRQFSVHCYAHVQECRQAILASLEDGVSVSVGGSTTLKEMKILDDLQQNQKIRYFDRYHCEDKHRIFHQAFNCDLYLCSVNAITMEGELVLIDGTGNRAAALLYGPRRVLIIAGSQKLVRNRIMAKERIRKEVAPRICAHLKKSTPCAAVGYCMDCQSPERICNAEVIIQQNPLPGRIHIMLVNETLGF